jgi:23S rRNA (guanosine2251-2'-O)-methyltransferase
MGSTVIYGVNPVTEALLAGGKVDTVYLAVGLRKSTKREIEQLAVERGVRVLVIKRRELDRMAAGGAHQGVLATAEKTPYLELFELVKLQHKPRTVVLCLDGIQDPRNLGALARSAAAFKAAGLIIPERRSVGITPAAVKASAGALTRLPVCRVKNLSRALDVLKEAGFWVSGAVSDGGQAPWEFDPGDRVALVLGSEGSGVRRGLLDRLDFRVRVPMHKDSESLNVSVAGASILYEWLVRPQKQ